MIYEDLKEKVAEMMKVEGLDEEKTRMVERIVVLRVSTKHINLWMRQLEIKRKEIGELAALLGLDGVKNEVEKKNLEVWAKRSTHSFTKKTKRWLFETIDNMIWSGSNEEMSSWCKRNKIYDEITDEEIEEIWKAEIQDAGEDIRLNGKYVWETAKKVCNFINAHEDLIHITSFGEYRDVMRKVMRVIKKAHETQRKRRQTGKKKRIDEALKRTQKAKAIVAIIKQGKMTKEEAMKRLEVIFGKGSSQEIEKATTNEKIVERIVELSKREER